MGRGGKCNKKQQGWEGGGKRGNTHSSSLSKGLYFICQNMEPLQWENCVRRAKREVVSVPIFIKSSNDIDWIGI
jgi:hypothetical protein